MDQEISQPFWTKEREEQLTALRADGYSASLIAAKFGCTRNQIMGKMNRMGLMGRSVHFAPNGRPQTNFQRPTERPFVPKSRIPMPEPASIGPESPSYAFLALTFDEVAGRKKCMYALGEADERRFCGNPGYPWCVHCHEIVYTKPEPRERKPFVDPWMRQAR